jgi:hypothetical protein
MVKMNIYLFWSMDTLTLFLIMRRLPPTFEIFYLLGFISVIRTETEISREQNLYSNLFYSFMWHALYEANFKWRLKFCCDYSKLNLPVSLSMPMGEYHWRQDVVDIQSINYAEAKNIFKLQNFRNYSLYRNLIGDRKIVAITLYPQISGCCF